jgi:branched-chain amino acid transport system ATP-binding protein
MSEALLEVSKVSKRFGGLQALSDVSLSIERGQIYGLIGPNGAGKTTMFNVITGLYQADAGEFRLGGVEYSPKAPHRVAAIGIARTFQNIRLFGGMSALENVLVGTHMHGVTGVTHTLLKTKKFRHEEATARDAARELMRFVGVAHLEDRMANTLSYGDQRRLEIARALATRPKLLALDEPAAGMNLSEKVALRNLLHRIREMGVAILLIEHDVKLVMGLCDEITVLDYGKVIVRGSPETVRSNPDFIRAYLGHSDLIVQ